MKSQKLEIKSQDRLVYIEFPHFNESQLVHHGFSTKHGGISQVDYSTMNLSFTRGDNRLAVVENFNRFASAIGVEPDSLVFTDQVHENDVRVVTYDDRGKGFDKTSDIIATDGLITNVKGVTLTTFYADCVPLFFLDPVLKVIGLSHAGWRGTVKEIGPKTVEAMTNEYGSNPEDILVGIGPSIGACCYEVSKDVIMEFEKILNRVIIDKIVFWQDEEHALLDLWEANKQLLIQAGVLKQNILVTDLCTKCHSDDFFSHRVMGTSRGSLAAMLALRS